MKTWIVLLGFLFLTACRTDEELVPICGRPCVVSSEGSLITEGAEGLTCHLGTVKCEDDGTQTCIGSRLPSRERCEDNSVDQDCSGDPDNAELDYFNPLNDCSETQLGVCKASTKICVNDEWICQPLMPELLGTEICDGLDNDCDGFIDTQDPSFVLSGPEWQYNGPPETANVGVCRAGHRVCVDGDEYFIGEVRPAPKDVCLNQLDDDCDGAVDEEDTVRSPVAYLIPVDVSGSMDPYHNDIRDAMCAWASQPEKANDRFALLAVGDGMYDPPISILSDFVNAEGACNSLTNFRQTVTQISGSEYVPLSIIYSQIESGFMYLEWPLGLDRSVIFFSDEWVQAYMNQYETEAENIAYEIEWIIELCLENDFTVSGFISEDYSTWQTLVNGCGGWIEWLSTSSIAMRQALNESFAPDCQ